MEKGWSMMIAVGFHKISRAPVAPFESIWVELQVLQQRKNMSYSSSPTDFVSCKRRMSRFSTQMLSRRVLCLDLLLSPLIFHVIIFIMMSWGVDWDTLLWVSISSLSWACSSLLPWWVDVQICSLDAWIHGRYIWAQRLCLRRSLILRWILWYSRWKLYAHFWVVLLGCFAVPFFWRPPSEEWNCKTSQ